jgi:general nucleoside transport system permease protein
VLRLEPRAKSSALMQALTPVMAVAATMVAGGILFAILGKNPLEAIRIIFVDPLFDPYSRNELAIKAAPLILIAVGLSFGFRAGVWNIGAEGQFVIGGLTGSAVALAFWGTPGVWLLPLMAVAGAAGGMAWAMIPAILKIRFNANEILVSLMLVYVAGLLLSAMVSGPLRDPQGFNFPQSRNFHDSARLPVIIEGTRVHLGVLVAFVAVVAAHVALNRHVFGFRVRLMGEAPRAADFAGVRRKAMVAICLGLSGALAGLAGLFEVAGPIGQLQPSLPVGYGFTAIIVAFLGRLNPVGILLAGFVMALTYIGGETAQFMLRIPAAAISVFQGMLLFFLLAMDILTRYRLVRVRRGAA